MSANPYTAPQADLETTHSGVLSREYPGITRMPYFGWSMLAGVLSVAILLALGIESGTTYVVINVLSAIASFVIAYYRLINIGDNGWLCLLLIVPIANLYVGIRCLACQTGYVETRKFDKAGKIVLGLFFGFIILVVLAIAIPALAPN